MTEQPEDEGSSIRKEFYQNLAKEIESQASKFDSQKDVVGQIDFLEQQVVDQRDMKKKLEIRKKIIELKTDLEIKKIKIANKTVKKHILEIVKQTAIRQGVYNTEEAKK